MAPIPYMECRTLVMGSPTLQCDFNDLCLPITLYGMWEHCHCQWCIPYMPYGNLVMGTPPTCTIWFACGNLVTINDSWPSIPYMECRTLVMGSPYMYNMIFVNDLCSPHTLYWIWKPCKGVPPHVQCYFLGQLRKRSTACPNQLPTLKHARFTIFMDTDTTEDNYLSR